MSMACRRSRRERRAKIDSRLQTRFMNQVEHETNSKNLRVKFKGRLQHNGGRQPASRRSCPSSANDIEAP